MTERTSSDTTGKIATALAKAQQEFGKILKNAPAHNYKYAPLDEVIEKTKSLAANGIATTYQTSTLDGKLFLACVLYHNSGEWLSSGPMEVIADTSKRMSPMQQLGSALTYARRYALQQIAGVAAEEDCDDSREKYPKQAPPVANPPQKPEQAKTPVPIKQRIFKALKLLTENYTNTEELLRIGKLCGFRSSEHLNTLGDRELEDILETLTTIYNEQQKRTESE